MDTSKIIPIAGVIAVAIGILIVIGMFAKAPAPAEPEETYPQMLPYSSPEFGITFEYPDTYRLEERTETYEDESLKVIILVDKNAVVPDMSEGPTAISLIIAGNLQDLPLEEWVRTKSISNYQLSQDGTLMPTMVDGVPGVAYQHSGLYENDAVAAAYSARIYLFSVGWIVEDQPIRQDFEQILQSVNFI